jgi:hypothetical protein
MVSIRLSQRAAASLALSLALVVSACIFDPPPGDPNPNPDPRLARDSIDNPIDYVETVWR